ncbi:DUF1365 domain-containing protein [Teredinibacter purpureus]|uniref:DUF1365 domain-containing protein n=1 Tax=Teredinibacter purpureus TaxID=2731756 RepID=UPI000A43174A|nr:DUF1365 domain-containing protein [Teredinibacter purpureus]
MSQPSVTETMKNNPPNASSPSSLLVDNAIFKGWVSHKRFAPKLHQFRYAVFMVYLNLDRLDSFFAKSRWWSNTHWSLARYKREDYYGDPSVPLKDSVLRKVNATLGLNLSGDVTLLTNVRYFGFIINPITLYYCFDTEKRLQAMLLEVTNTPWNNRHSYVLKCDPMTTLQRINFDKDFHVSPFHPMQMQYALKANKPGERIAVTLTSGYKGSNGDPSGENVFYANLTLKYVEATKNNLNTVLITYPFMTLKVCLSIYWQALKLLLKRLPIYRYKTQKKI